MLYPQNLIASMIQVTNEDDGTTTWAVQTDRGVLCVTHGIGQSGAKLCAAHNQTESIHVDWSSLLISPLHKELGFLKSIFVPSCATTTSSHYTTPVAGKPCGMLNPNSTSVGEILFVEDTVENNVTVNFTTKAGDCGSPYITNGKIVGIHWRGNMNKHDNSGIALLPKVREWFTNMPKN